MKRLLNIEQKFCESEDRKSAVAENAMVSTAFPEATEAGIEMLRKGGNVVDAACASALAIGVCEPQASGIGGQSMVIMHLNGKTIALDGSSHAPALAHIDSFNENDDLFGHKATTIPSTVAVLGYLNFHYGKLKWSEVVEPAIRIALEGYKITKLQSFLQNRELEKFLKAPSRSGADYFLKNGKEPYQPGELFVQSDLANTLTYLADNEPKSFYQGMIAQRIDEDMRNNDGFLRADDLAYIRWPKERKVLRRSYRQLRMVSIPPPAAGRTLLLVLMILDHLSSKFFKQKSIESIHLIAESMRKAFLFRKQRPFDPNTFTQISDREMISREFAKRQAKSIAQSVDPTLPLIDPVLPDSDTTHLSVMDKNGNCVGITQSIELAYGAKVAAEGLGFLYNNYMRAFEKKDPSHPHYLRPMATPWTTVSPFILFHHKEPWLIAGSPGSERIYSTLGQFVVNMLDKGMSMYDAVAEPRFHCSIGGTITYEQDCFTQELLEQLKDLGYKLKEKPAQDFYFGAVHAVMRCHETHQLHGIAEVRRDGIAGGF